MEEYNSDNKYRETIVFPQRIMAHMLDLVSELPHEEQEAALTQGLQNLANAMPNPFHDLVMSGKQVIDCNTYGYEASDADGRNHAWFWYVKRADNGKFLMVHTEDGKVVGYLVNKVKKRLMEAAEAAEQAMVDANFAAEDKKTRLDGIRIEKEREAFLALSLEELRGMFEADKARTHTEMDKRYDKMEPRKRVYLLSLKGTRLNRRIKELEAAK